LGHGGEETNDVNFFLKEKEFELALAWAPVPLDSNDGKRKKMTRANRIFSVPCLK
jgi:hypothetical protein